MSPATPPVRHLRRSGHLSWPSGHRRGGLEGRPGPTGGAPPGRRRRPVGRDRASLVA